MHKNNTTDLTFITNQEGQSLLDRFHVLIKDTRFFDILVGYFYTSGFYQLYKSLENTEKIRILVGISLNPEAVNFIKNLNEPSLSFSHVEIQEKYSDFAINEISNADDRKEVEEGIRKFIEWLSKGKLEIRVYPSENIHAKLYIMTFKEGDRDIGRVITGSSNFTKGGLKENLEFNVELKSRADYEFAKSKFEELWEQAVDVRDIYLDTLRKNTWLNESITPYELYLKFLYEYFKDDLNLSDEVFLTYIPQNFKKFEYQQQAVLNAKKILEEYGGVFLSDVVGLGKTYIAAMLANQLDGRTYVIAPPALLDRNNPGSWPNVFSDFRVQADFGSIGKLDDVIEQMKKREYKNVIIDEAHRFRNEATVSYEKLVNICKGKRVILVTATPYNNSPRDLLNQIKLFQNPKKSTIPNLQNLEGFFNRLEKKLKAIDKEKDYEEYIEAVKENSKEIREKVLKYLMVRRTRTEIERYFRKDIEIHKLRFPKVVGPEPIYYELNETEEDIFDQTIWLITQKITYSRYQPLLYYKHHISLIQENSQRNMGKFMKILLVKRLESSFYAFLNTINRFIRSYERFIEEFEKGYVYVSKKHINKIFELLENDDDEAVQRLIDEGEAERYDSSEFHPKFKTNLLEDLETLKFIKKRWEEIDRDPKLEELKKQLAKRQELQNKKIVIFTESKETAEYLASNLGSQVLCFHGNSSGNIKDKVIENFDASANNQKNDYRILVSTEVLSEGVNLHRSNIVINYDIPWNPTRMMQRVGRVNRIGTEFEEIYVFNFFPTAKAENEIRIREIAESKINAFITLLGNDAAILTEGEPIASHELFDRLISKKAISGEDAEEESELKYLNVIKEIRDKNPDLFEKVKKLPKKARSAKKNIEYNGCLLTYFRMGKLQKFFIATKDKEPQEIDFLTAAKIFECSINEARKTIREDFYDLLQKNKKAFEETTSPDAFFEVARSGRSKADELKKIIKAALNESKRLTEDQEDFLINLLDRIEEGSIPKNTISRTIKALKDLQPRGLDVLEVISTIKQNIPENLLKTHYVDLLEKNEPKVREIILSLYLTKGE